MTDSLDVNEASGQGAGPVVVLYTGGTFGMVPSARGLVPDPNLEAEVGAILAPNSRESARAPWVYAATTEAIDSSELDPETLGELADLVRDLVVRERPRAVVVIHGTDTMAYSAAFAAFALADVAVPVIFTGSQLPLRSEGSDAQGNLEFAFAAATGTAIGTAAGATARRGVWIAFDGRLMPAVRARKRSSESMFGFVATRHLAPGGVMLEEAPVVAAGGADATPRVSPDVTAIAGALQQASGTAAPRVGLVKATPWLSAAQLEAVISECPAGVVLECYGAGTAPMSSARLTAPLERAAELGVPVLAITQCEDGAVELGRYAVGSELVERGVLDGSDMTPEAALAKLSALARAGFTGERLREAILTNLVGEREA